MVSEKKSTRAIKKKNRGSSLAESEEFATLDLGIIGSRPTLGVEIT